MNPLAKRLFGRDENHRDFLSLNTILYQKPGESEDKGPSLAELLPFQQNIKGLRLDFLSNKEETVPVLLSTQVIKNNFYSNHTMLLGYDLSEINRYEEELRVFNEKYNLLLKATNEAVFDVDAKTGLLNWGGGYQAFFGHFPANLPRTVGEFCHRIHKDDLERFQSIVSRMEKREKNVLNLEYRIRSDGDGYLYVLQRSYVVSDPMGNPIRIVGALKDVTQEKKHLRELTRKNEKLKEIAWIQSHEVRRPLSNILGLIDMLHMDSCISEKEKKGLFDALKKSGIELDRIIHRIVEKSTNLRDE
jgi:PAS domain-containing protein